MVEVEREYASKGVGTAGLTTGIIGSAGFGLSLLGQLLGGGAAAANAVCSETTAVAESMGVTFAQISPWSWWAAMNMMYSDYYTVGAWYKVDVPDFYACQAKAFLLDEDAAGPEEKLAAYYRNIASE